MAKRTSTKAIAKENPGGDRIDFKKIMVDLKPDPATGKTVRKLRLIGDPIEFYEAMARKRADDGTKKNIQVPFPDADTNKRFNRICGDDLENDVWAKMGYITTKRFAINVIDREDGCVKILNKGKSIFKKFAEYELNNVEENMHIEDGDEMLCTRLGGEIAPDIKITAIHNPSALGEVEYQIYFMPKSNKITNEEIEKLRAAGTPSASEMAILKEEYPDDPDWMFFGHNLEEIFKPSVLREKAESTPTEEMTISKDDDDDDSTDEEEVEEIEEVKPAKTTKSKAPKEEELDDVEW